MGTKKREIIAWITIGGKHIPIFEGQTKEDVAKAHSKGGVYKKSISEQVRKDIDTSGLKTYSKNDILTTRGKSKSSGIYNKK